MKPPSANCTVTMTILVIIIVWSSEIHFVVNGKLILVYFSKPSNSQLVLCTGTCYTLLIVGLGLVKELIIHFHLPLTSLCYVHQTFFPRPTQKKKSGLATRDYQCPLLLTFLQDH